MVYESEGTITAGVDYPGVCVVFYCHDGNGNWLFHKRSARCRDEQGAWDNGGGKLEFGEDLVEGALRELREEYGCTGEIQEHLPALTVLREQDGTKSHWIAFGYIIKVNPDDVVIGDPDSMECLAWHRLDSLPSPIHSVIPRRLQEQAEYFQKYR